MRNTLGWEIHLDLAALVQKQILTFEVAVDHITAMAVLQPYVP
jgi:hypothetical protein